MGAKYSLLILAGCLILGRASSQDYNWWNTLHNWDGVTSWKHYLSYTSKYMGPNALPVPSISKADLPAYTELRIGVQQHLSEGDKTINFITGAYLPIVPERVSLRAHYIPVEFYETDTSTRDLRAARDRTTKGFSYGDIYISTLIQIIKDHEKLPDLTITLGLKTASGTNLGNARHTDAPGYYFSSSIGRTFQTGAKILSSLRPYFTGGFYSYHTNRSDYLQNDTFLFGLGAVLETSLCYIENEIAGYLGYFGNGDQPAVYRLKFTSRRESIQNYGLQFQYGLHDVDFTSVSISALLRFEDVPYFFGKKGSGGK